MFRDNIPNTSIKKCIVNICQARDIWEAKDKEDYPKLKLNIAQDIYKKAGAVKDHIQRNEIFYQARKLSKPLFDHLVSDYHTLAIMAIYKAWSALEGMLRDGKLETDSDIKEQAFDSSGLIETANKLLSDAKQINLKDKVNTLEDTIKYKKKIVRETVEEALRSKEDVLVYNKKTRNFIWNKKKMRRSGRLIDIFQELDKPKSLYTILRKHYKQDCKKGEKIHNNKRNPFERALSEFNKKFKREFNTDRELARIKNKMVHLNIAIKWTS